MNSDNKSGPRAAKRPDSLHNDRANRDQAQSDGGAGLRELIAWCGALPDVYEDYPFGAEWAVMRHRGNKKSFALFFELRGHPCVNLKCEPMRADLLREAFEAVSPGYHMNKVHWNTVTLDLPGLPLAELHDMIRHSYELTRPKTSTRKPVK